MKRDGVLRHVGRVDADDLARREPACSQPGSTAIDLVDQLRVGQRCAADGIDDGRTVATCGGVGEHEIGERDVRHVHVRVRAADRHRLLDSTGRPNGTRGECHLAVVRCDDPRMTATRPSGPALPGRATSTSSSARPRGPGSSARSCPTTSAGRRAVTSTPSSGRARGRPGCWAPTCRPSTAGSGATSASSA